MTRTEKELRTANRRVLRAELRNYWVSKKTLEEDIADLCSPGCNYPDNDADQIRGTETSDPTGRKALRLFLAAEIRERRRRIEAMEHVVNRLAAYEPEKYRLVQLHYWNGLYTPEGVRQQLHIDMRTYQRWHKQILDEMAERLGWVI